MLGEEPAPPAATRRPVIDVRGSDRPIFVGLVAFAALVVIGTCGYMLIEGWSAIEALYMVIITLSTVGFGEVRPLSPAGQLFTSTLIITGVTAFAYVAASFYRLALEGELTRAIGRRRMDKEIHSLRQHFIVCGYGRVGREVCRNLLADNVPLIVIEQSEEPIRLLEESHLPYLRGNAVDEEVLREAGIDRARGLLLTMSDEANNVYATLIAKEHRRDIQVISRSITSAGERRLRAAGADRVVSPEMIGARSMSNYVSRPNAVDFAEIVTAKGRLSLELEEQRLTKGSRFAGRSIRECEIRQKYSLIVVGLVTPAGEMLFNPLPDTELEAGTTLIILGESEDIKRFGADA